MKKKRRTPPPPHRSSPRHRRHYGPRDRRSDELTEVGGASYRGPIRFVQGQRAVIKICRMS